jgi:cytochrome P450
VQKKVRDEILRVLGDDLTPSMEQQKELKYMNMVINENLRLFPPVGTMLFKFHYLLKFLKR